MTASLNLTFYVVAVIVLATLIRSTLGFGEALVSVPLLALRIPVEVAAPLAVLVSVVVAGLVVVQDHQRIEFRAAGGLILASLVGIPFGLLLLDRAPDDVVKLLLGAVIVLFALYSLTVGRGQHLAHDHVGWLIGCGVIAGVLGGAYGMNGPPLAIYGALRRWPAQRFRATLQAYFLPASLAGLIGYALLGLWTPAVTRYFLWSLPGVAVATFAGRVLNRRLKGERFVLVVYGGLLLIGTVLVAQTVWR